ncbi:MAG: response regulator, partial [Alphaproteobacteria bacterium]
MLDEDARAVVKTHPANSVIPNVLVVDDDLAICEQLARVYKLSGYTVATVSSAEEALAQLAKNMIDFVVTDIKLPG